MLSILIVLLLALFAVEAAVIPTTTEGPVVNAEDDVSTPVPHQPHVCIFACVAGKHCGPVPCDDPSDSGCIGCVPDETPPCTNMPRPYRLIL